MTQIVEVAVAALWVIVAGHSLLLYRTLSRQNRMMAAQKSLQDDLEEFQRILTTLASPAAPPVPSGLEVGTQAPAISLPDLSGRERRLEEFLGRPLVVTFFSPSCGFCLELAPRLGNLPETGPGMLVITQGGADENLRLARDHKWHCDVLLDERGQVTQAYRISGTPMGYLLDADGRVKSERAVGAEAVLGLLGSPLNGHSTLTAESLQQKQQAAVERARQAGLSLRESKLDRQGLEPGRKAPDFTIPDLDGKKHSLASFLDKRVLLVFSDPNCGPCDTLAPELVRIHQGHLDDDLRIVMISRGDLDANREKAQRYGFSFPVLLQKRWEISKEYAMFATPIAYLINRDSIIAEPVAVGRDSIIGLVAPR